MYMYAYLGMFGTIVFSLLINPTGTTRVIWLP